MVKAKENYVCSLTTIVRTAVEMTKSRDSVQTIVEGILEEIEEKGVAPSLQVPLNGVSSARQCDIRNEDKSVVIFKTFVTWDHKEERWHVFVEMGDEDTWEKHFKKIPNGVN